MSTSVRNKRILKEIAKFTKSEHNDIFIHVDQRDITKIYFMFIGPPDTPFQGGFFYFKLDMTNFPLNPPKASFLTPMDSTFRIHPNLYANGKVCLSMLGTWGNNTWSPILSLEKIIITIQALLDNNPLTHEPGFEKVKLNEVDGLNYAVMSRYLTMLSIPFMMKRTDMPVEFKEHMTNYLVQQFSSPNNIYEQSMNYLDEFNGKIIKTMHNNRTITGYRFDLSELI
jgi:ubiquitin-conjugating enzyme E2 Z